MYSNLSIKTIILAGSSDFGRCPVASRLPTVFWPVLGRPSIERLLIHLSKQGLEKAVICVHHSVASLADSIKAYNYLELEFFKEALPCGTAGAVRGAVGSEGDSLLIVLPANIARPPEIDVLLKAHRQGRSELTVMLNPARQNNRQIESSAGIYIIEPDLLKSVPGEGYLDIKEGLIPQMLREGKNVYAATLSNDVGNFRERRGYLCAIANYLESAKQLDEGLKRTERFGSQNIWISDDVNIHPTARLYGPIVIMQGSDISRGAVIIGPTMIGRDVRIGENSIVINSALWDDSKVSSNCEIRGCIIDYQVDIPCHRTIQDQSIPFQPRKIFIDLFSGALKLARNNIGSLNRALQKPLAKINECLPNWVKLHKSKFVTFVLGLLLISTFLWSYWPDILDLWDIWQRSDEYSSGLLVPFLSIYILWSRRQSIAQYKVKPSVWGLFAFVAAQAFRLFGLFFMFASAERLSIVLSIAALVLFLFGWQLFKKVFTILIFLFLMLPWPNRVQAAVALPLQRWATSSAVFCLEMMGCEAVQEGNIIHIGSSSVAVVEACNGLRMVTAFFVISGLVVLIVRRKLWEKAIVLASSLPIALICNTVRLTITALAFTVVSGEYWEKIFHDFGGYAMMPLALAMVVAELWLLTKLTTAPVEKNVVVVNRQKR